MDSIEKELSKERKVIYENRKILRSKPLVFAQRYIWFLLVAFAIVLTVVFGVYDIKKILLVNNNTEYIKQRDIENLTEEYFGKNFFCVNPERVEESIKTNSYIKNADVEKVFPNRLDVQIEEYKPFILFEMEDKSCKVFSEEGMFLEVKEEVDCETFAEKEMVIYFVGKETQIVQENNKEHFYMADDLLNVSKVLKEFDIVIEDVVMSDDILNISTDSMMLVMDINQEQEIQLARLYIVLEELEKIDKQAESIDVRFERPVIQIDN